MSTSSPTLANASAPVSKLTRADLSPDQSSVYESMQRWIRSGDRRHNILTIGGYAGVGKTFLLSLFAAETDLSVAYICFTGRASSILGRKLDVGGVPTTNRSQQTDEKKLRGRWGHMFYAPWSAEARRPFCGTIHRLVYRAVIDNTTEELRGWEKRDVLDRDYDLVVLDEASMVDRRMLDDILRHDKRVMAVGDHGQLPPVMGDGSLMRDPVLRLEKIHRQAEGSPIIQLSRAIREDQRMDRSLADGKRLVFTNQAGLRSHVIPALVGEPPLDTAMLCYRNATRVHVNRTVREYRGYAGKFPQRGEPVVCLRNYPPVYNGMRGVLTKDAVQPYRERPWILRAEIEFPDEGIPGIDYEICMHQFHRGETFKSVDDLRAGGMHVFSMGEAGHLFDFAYAMTVHKMQGSQVPHAVVVADWRHNYRDDFTRRLAYTAATRAQERLTLIV